MSADTDKSLVSSANISAGAAQNNGKDVYKTAWSKTFNSFWFIGLLVFAAVLITSVDSSAPVPRNPSIVEKNLIQSHFKAVSHTSGLSLRVPQAD
jgi:hypothetical protein